MSNIIDRSKFTIMFVMMIMAGLLLEVAAQNECASDSHCEAKYRLGSVCLESGQCSNPFVDGCLKRMDTDVDLNRLCNSDDKNQENCRLSPFNYPEIRVHNQDWEVAIFLSWILQVSMMELLGVPVTVGLDNDTSISSFYNIENNLPYSSSSYAWHALKKANEMDGNCLLTDEECAHVIPDVWMGQNDVYEKEYRDGQLDYLDGNGQVGKISWFVPKFTASRHPFTVTHMGLSQDRHRLAHVFKRPTAWVDYCHEVSQTNCSVPDKVADRYPNEADTGMYFADGYVGHFRHTAENNCTGINSTTCSGHIVAPPCSWSSFVEAQAYWNNITLESSGPLGNGGYSYGEMLQIWNAASATESDVIMWWFEPDAFLEQYRNTESEFTKVYLPTPSIQCNEGRVSAEDRCSEDPDVRRGLQIGSCDNKAHVTKKAIATSLRDLSLTSSPVEQSPGYSFIINFNIDELEISKILKQFGDGGRTGFAAREAVCGWIANNTDYLERLIPPNYPRVIEYRTDYQDTATMTAFCVGVFAILYVAVSLMITYKKRKAAVFVYAQVQFIFLVLFGLLLVAIGAVLYGIEPDDNICMVRVWLVCLGYSFELVPLIIKVTALNRLMKASKKMRRMKININHLYSSVVALSLLVTIYLVVWTVVDPSRPLESRTLQEDSVTVTSHYGCRSESLHWQTAFNYWEGLLILWTAVLAFQSRTTKAEFNESKSLGMMIYSHCVFLILRIAVPLAFEDSQTSTITNSLLLSLDIIVALTIYLVPKLRKSMAAATVADQRNRTHFFTRSASEKPKVILPPDSSSNFGLDLDSASLAVMSFASEVRSPQPKPVRRIVSSATASPSQSQEFRRGSFALFAANQISVKELDILSDSETQHQELNCKLPLNSKLSLDAWVGNCNDSGDHDDSVPIPKNRRKLEFQGDADDEELREQLLERDQEVVELRKEVLILQETKTRHESRINELLEGQKQD